MRSGTHLSSHVSPAPDDLSPPVGSLPGGIRRGRWGGLTWLAVLIAIFVAVPVLSVVAISFTDTREFWRHLAETALDRYVGNTLWILVGVTIGVLIGGVGSAWLVSLCSFPGRRWFEWGLLLPFAMPAYVIAYTYAGLFDFSGPIQASLRDVFGWTSADQYWFPEIRSLPGAIVMLVLVLYPYVYLLSRAAFLEQSVCTLEVSRTLGCGPWRSMTRVALPLARPSIAAGTALALMEALNDFGTVQYFGVDTFTTGIYRVWLGEGNPSAASQLAVILLLFIFGLLLLERWSRGRARYMHTTNRYRPLPEYRLRGWRGIAASVFCALPVLFGFLFPVIALVGWSIMTAADVIDTRFVRLAVNSFVLAASAAILAVLFALIMAYAVRSRPTRVVRGAIRLSSMGYAVPGAVLAVGIVLPFAAFDNALDGWMRNTFGVSTGLLLSGGMFALLFAYLARFLPISYGTVESGMARVTPHMDDAARNLGQGTRGILWRVHAPILRSSLLTAGLLVFVDVMKELPATLMIRPFNLDTLAIRTYEFATDEQLDGAAPSALAIVLVGILPVILLSRAISRGRPGSGKAQHTTETIGVPA